MNRLRPRASAVLATLLFLIAFILVGFSYAPAEELPDVVTTKLPLTGAVELRYQRSRSGAPVPIVWTLDWNGQTILEGDLEFDVEDNGQLVGRFRIPDMVLSPGKNAFHSMLPPLSVFKSSIPIMLRPRFVTAKQTFEMSEQALRVPSRYVQWFNFGIISGATSLATKAETRLFESIGLERFLPPADVRDRSTTVTLDLHASELPNEPLTLCNFDVVVLLPSSLLELRDEQTNALRKWVIAGGSLCVVPGGGLNRRHAALLNDLLSESARHEPLVVDGRGFLAPGEEALGNIISARKGLGRVVVLREARLRKLTPTTEEWLTACSFLIKARHTKLEPPNPFAIAGMTLPAASPLNGGVPTFAPPVTGPSLTVPQQAVPKNTVPQKTVPQKTTPPNMSRQTTSPQSGTATQEGRKIGKTRQQSSATVVPRSSPTASTGIPVIPRNPGQNLGPNWGAIAARTRFDPNYVMRSQLSPPPLGVLDELVQVLMPRDVQVVPLSMIAAILAAYVVTIGPIDYLLLGILRMRRLTWVLFPAVTIGFAGFTLWLSRSYLGTNDSRRAIEFCDMVPGGTVARQTRIELMFLSEPLGVRTEVQNGIFSQIGLGALPDPRRPGLINTSSVGRIDQKIIGRFPSRYAADQTIPQWTPAANRYFWFDPPPAKIDAASASGRPGTAPQADFNWDESVDFKSSAGRAKLSARIERAFGKEACAVAFHGDAAPLPVFNSFDSLRLWQPKRLRYVEPVYLENIVGALSEPAPERFFSYASQLAPNGGPGLDDLALLDGSDPEQWLLVIAVENGSKLTLYRRLYVGGT